MPTNDYQRAKLSKNESRQDAGSIDQVWKSAIVEGKENLTFWLDSDSRNGRLSKRSAIGLAAENAQGVLPAARKSRLPCH